MNQRSVVSAIVCLGLLTISAARLQAQQDPGPRGGQASAGSFYPMLSGNEQANFAEALKTFMEVDSVSGTMKGEDGSGLGPTFNGNGCAQCHAQPAIGGSSPGMKSPQNPMPNPQVGLATLDGATNTVPSFISADGPVREARFVYNITKSGVTADGGVHGLYTITGRTDSNGCLSRNRTLLRRWRGTTSSSAFPRPSTDWVWSIHAGHILQANTPGAQAQRSRLGEFAVRFNTNGNDGTITRFGWKAQNKSLLIFPAKLTTSSKAYRMRSSPMNARPTGSAQSTQLRRI